jgi:hypothetical protein
VTYGRKESIVNAAELQRPGENEGQEEPDPHISLIQKEKDEEQKNTEGMECQNISNSIRRITARIHQDIERLMRTWNRASLFREQLEGAFAPPAHTVKQLIEQKWPNARESNKIVRLSAIRYAVVVKATGLMRERPSKTGMQRNRDIMRKLAMIRILTARYLVLYRCFREYLHELRERKVSDPRMSGNEEMN